MPDLNQVAVSLGEVSLSVADWLVSLRRRGSLQSLLRDAVVEHFLVQQAKQAGVTLTTDELQRAADLKGQRQGLVSAEQTHAWLARQRLSMLDFEDALERDLLIDKLKDHLTRDRIAGHFEANQAGYARAQLRLILVQRQDEARELLLQLREEGRDFAELAREHSLHPSRSQGGSIGLVRRRQLPPAAAEAVFASRTGDVVGPVGGPEGFSLFLVESLAPAELDAPTTALICQELFDAWLAATLRGVPTSLPLLDLL